MSHDESCIFCKIVSKKIPATVVAENGEVLIFKDLHPQAKVHVLAIPKKHSKNIIDTPSEQREAVFNFIKEWAGSEGLLEKGFRLVTNSGAGGGQTVFHFHVHLLSGQLTDKFG